MNFYQRHYPLLQHLFLRTRQCFAVCILLCVTYLSLSDSDGMRQHEVMHFLVSIHRIVGCEVDKIVHFLMYFAVSGALWIALPARLCHLPSPLCACLIATCWGFLMELLQALLTWLAWASRAFDLMDAFANFLGATTAALCAALCMWIWKRFITPHCASFWTKTTPHTTNI